MESHVIGFFENRPEADQACEDLRNAGFSSSEIGTFVPGQGRVEQGGIVEKLKNLFGGGSSEDRQIYAEAARRGEIAVAVSARDDAQIDRAVDIFERHHAIDLDRNFGQGTTSQTWTGHMAGAQPQSSQPQSGQEQVLPVTEEELKVGKREVSKGGVRVSTKSTETPVQQEVNLREEHISIERRPADRPAGPGEASFQERTIEATESAEEAVISKQARVKEEVVIRKDVQQKTQPVSDTIRRTDVNIEKLGPEEAAQLADDFSSQLANDQRFTGRDWSSMENDARLEFEQRYPGEDWSVYRGRIESGYDRLRRKS